MAPKARFAPGVPGSTSWSVAQLGGTRQAQNLSRRVPQSPEVAEVPRDGNELTRAAHAIRH
jgi:hypothetical protein